MARGGIALHPEKYFYFISSISGDKVNISKPMHWADMG